MNRKTKRGATMVLGVTGSIGCGKSTVTGMFRGLGAAVVSADELAREAVLPGSNVLEQLAANFGPEILLSDGTLDREALARRIFADPTAREALNRITHPVIGALAERRLQELAAAGGPLVVYEAPLLFEAGAAGRVDAVLVVTVTAAEQLRRLRGRDGLSPAEARRRIAAQMSQAAKVARADFVIDNSGSLAATSAQVERLYRLLTVAEPPPAAAENRG